MELLAMLRWSICQHCGEKRPKTPGAYYANLRCPCDTEWIATAKDIQELFKDAPRRDAKHPAFKYGEPLAEVELEVILPQGT
jgi:hypothetical protein